MINPKLKLQIHTTLIFKENSVIAKRNIMPKLKICFNAAFVMIGSTRCVLKRFKNLIADAM
jgi:hypothetical protein